MLVICIICSGTCNVNKEKISAFLLRFSAKTIYMHSIACINSCLSIVNFFNNNVLLHPHSASS